MLVTNRVVQPVPLHKDVTKGNVQMDSKEFKFGNSTVIVHSNLVYMSKQERQEWFEKEWQKENPVLKNIIAAVRDCLQSS